MADVLRYGIRYGKCDWGDNRLQYYTDKLLWFK